MVRSFKHIAMTYMKVLRLQEAVSDLASSMMLLSGYPDDYEKHIDAIHQSLNDVLNNLEFKYK